MRRALDGAEEGRGERECEGGGGIDGDAAPEQPGAGRGGLYDISE